MEPKFDYNAARGSRQEGIDGVNAQASDAQKYEELKDQQRKDRQEKRIAREEARRTSNAGEKKGLGGQTIQDAKNLMEDATPTGIISLFMQANILSDWMYILALMAAILKDFFDFVSLTGFLYVVAIVVTFLCSIFIAMMMLLGSFSHGVGRAQQKMIRSWLVLLGGTTAEMLFGLNFLPIQTFTVIIVYILLLSSRRHSAD